MKPFILICAHMHELLHISSVSLVKQFAIFYKQALLFLLLVIFIISSMSVASATFLVLTSHHPSVHILSCLVQRSVQC